MKLAAIYNVWDGSELLEGSINCLKNHVDLFIIIWQDVSNFGEYFNPLPDIPIEDKIILRKYIPKSVHGSRNEISKRQLGLDIAKQNGCTHFIHLDCDEYYEDFGKSKQAYIESGHKGSVCKMFTYFKEPTLRLENPDNYFVPFIHELRPDTLAGNKKYPFYCDPTRRINENDVIGLPFLMHHYSWIRKDAERKARNSSARNNILKSNLLKDYNGDISEGYFLKDYNQKLIRSENIFNIEI